MKSKVILSLRVLSVLIIILLATSLSFADRENVAESLEKQLFRAKQELKDLDYKVIEELLQEVKEGSNDTEEKIKEIKRLLIESLKVETRAIWLDSVSMDLLTSKEKIVELMDLLSSVKVNLILADIFGNGHSVFPSQYAKQREAFYYFAKGDMLPIMIEEAHNRGIEFHGLASIFGVDSKGIQPFMDMDKLDWFDRTVDGSFLTGITEFEAFMSPVVPEVREFFLGIIKEMAQYDLDGIHLDYIRYGKNLGYHPLALDLYRKEGGNPDNLANPKELEHFLAFKASFITSFVEEVKKEVQAINPRLLLSAAVASGLNYAKRELGQDWKDWADKKLLHFICHMCYTTTSDLYYGVIDSDTSPISSLSISFPGIGLYAIDEFEMERQLEVGQNKPVAGQALFSAIHLNPQKAEALKNGVYRDIAIPTFRDPQYAASRIIADLGRRLEILGLEIGIDPKLNTELIESLTALAEKIFLPLRPFDNRDLQVGSEAEYEALKAILQDFKTLKKPLSKLPLPARKRALNDLAKAERLVKVLFHYSKIE